MQNAESTLFVHFDKNIYSNNDQVWFTGYLLKTITNLNNYHTLYVSLVNNKDSTVVLQDKFLIDSGFSFGNLTLPDSLPGGSYRFVVSTNIKVKGEIDGEFIQPILIKSTTKNPLIANVSIFKSYDEQTKNGTALLKILTSDNRFVENAEIKYTIGRNKIMRSGSAKSSVIGELMIDFPADKIEPENNLLTISIKKDNQLRYIKYDLPIFKPKKYKVNFYPESGYLVNGLNGKVGFEVKDLENNVIKLRAVLYQGNNVIDTISSNTVGLGSFHIKPNIDKKYTIKLLTADQEEYWFELPEILKNGVTINAKDVVADNDLRVQLQSNINTKVYAIVHDYLNVSLQSEFDLKQMSIQNVKFNLDSVPIGLNTLTILDSSFKPVAERIFFAHYDQLNQLQILTDKEEYNTRDSVQLSLKVASGISASFQGLVSIACVQTNRFSTANNINIVDYSLLEKELVKLPVNPMGLKISDRDFLNDVLLIKGWRKYKWPLIKQNDLKNRISSAEVTGQILKGKKKPGEPITINAITQNTIHSVTSDDSGSFNIPFESLITTDKDQIWLNLGVKNPANYTLTINDPVNEIKKQLQKQHYETEITRSMIVIDHQNISAPGGINLKEVTIKGGQDNFTFVSNKCGDYVCPYNILNCPNHQFNSTNKPPIEGKSYSNGRGGTIVYGGCRDQGNKSNIYMLKGINLPKEFYVSDIKNKNEPINFATVYWNYQKQLNNEGEANVTFNTGDLTGSFKIIIQGVTRNGVVYGEKYISIKHP
ncbi:hypothetical protein [Pedobacter chinensis]|uniref:hypothetical protein n=1 Tax=Pedobacter chinensis TaxID=2282421 RepID=UPI0011C0734E|nr:hypothetical protein [Pedobacter chinensis]